MWWDDDDDDDDILFSFSVLWTMTIKEPPPDTESVLQGKRSEVDPSNVATSSPSFYVASLL